MHAVDHRHGGAVDNDGWEIAVTLCQSANVIDIARAEPGSEGLPERVDRYRVDFLGLWLPCHGSHERSVGRHIEVGLPLRFIAPKRRGVVTASVCGWLSTIESGAQRGGSA